MRMANTELDRKLQTHPASFVSQDILQISFIARTVSSMGQSVAKDKHERVPSNQLM